MRFRPVVGVILSPLLLASAARGEVVERILAVVGDRPLMLSEVRLVQQLRGLERAPALEALVDEQLMLREASRLAQSAVALYLFLRDVCGGDFISWIDDHLSRSKEPNAASIIDALRHIHGFLDKVL